MKKLTIKIFLAIQTFMSSTLLGEVDFFNPKFDLTQKISIYLKKNIVSTSEAVVCLGLEYKNPETVKGYTQAKLNNPLIATLCLCFANFFISDLFFKAYNRKSLTLPCIGRFFMYTLLKNPVITVQQALYWFGDATGSDHRSTIQKKLKDRDDCVEKYTQEWESWCYIPAKIATSPTLLAMANFISSYAITNYIITTSYDDCILGK